MGTQEELAIAATRALLPVDSNYAKRGLPASPLIISDVQPPQPVREFMDEMALEVAEAANSLFCSSIFFRSSEADEHGDVVVWVNTNFAATPSDVVRALQFEREGWRAPKIEFQTPPTATLSALKNAKTGHNAAFQLGQRLSSLTSPFGFSASGGLQKKIVIQGIFGKLTSDGQTGWLGLIGAGIWSDS